MSTLRNIYINVKNFTESLIIGFYLWVHKSQFKRFFQDTNIQYTCDN